ncbi:hypothetical protein LshimejAT787_0701010 [Lyophyllum shimeji]|uniref:Uncharacterized protein n=1 Tax=Lyophyllum shimeji TaxID=47721 RepID=A0A9P3PPV8_LYOSH|nr:hypothetical protein LshimejAT787_0701010 [Lyophyllum shimeji]
MSQHAVLSTPQDFIDAWKFELAHDFEKGGLPASWAPGQSGPKQWGGEDQKVDLPGNPTALALSADATSLAVAVNSEVLIYDANTFAVRRRRRYVGAIGLLAFHPSGRFLLSSSTVFGNRKVQESIHLWDLGAEAGAGDWLGAMPPALKASLEELFHTAELRRDVQRGDALEGHLAGFGSRPFTHDGKFLFYIGGINRADVVVYDVSERKERFRLQRHADAVMWVGSNPDDTMIATSSWDGTVKLWQGHTGALLHTLQAERHQFVNIYVWRVETTELISKLDGGPDWVRTLDFSMDVEKDAVYLAAGSSLKVCVFDIGTAERIQNWKVKHDGIGIMYEVQNVQYSPSDFTPRVLGIKTPDGRITVYDNGRNVKWEFEQPHTDAPRLYGTGDMVFHAATSSMVYYAQLPFQQGIPAVLGMWAADVNVNVDVFVLISLLPTRSTTIEQSALAADWLSYRATVPSERSEPRMDEDLATAQEANGRREDCYNVAAVRRSH